MADHNCPFEVRRLDKAVIEELKEAFKENCQEYALFGPKRYFIVESYWQDAATIYNMPLRTDDIFVLGFPRSGTTWTQELVWLINNNLDYDIAKEIPLYNRYSFLEQSAIRKQLSDETKKAMKIPPSVLAEVPSPRFIKSHLPLSLLSPNLLDTKVVYVARDPRDVIVSFYHFSKSSNTRNYTGDLKMFFDMFIRDIQIWTPYFEHVKEAWQQRHHHPNLLFLFYEDLIKDLVGVAKRMAKFFGKEYTDEQYAELAQFLHFDNFKNNKAVNLDTARESGVFKPDMKFIRKGKSGAWRESFDPEMTQRVEQWMMENMQGTDLVFPSVDC